jgi:hypothetical protein
VFTRSDLAGANVEGADFTNALLDKTQQMVSVQFSSRRCSCQEENRQLCNRHQGKGSKVYKWAVRQAAANGEPPGGWGRGERVSEQEGVVRYTLLAFGMQLTGAAPFACSTRSELGGANGEGAAAAWS